MSVQKYLELLFDKDEVTCFGVTMYDTKVRERKYTDKLVVINPLKPDTKRADANVTKYRNFLIEFDKGTIEEQLEFIKDSGIPYASIVYSGSKSLHVIVSLIDPVKDLNTYKELFKRISKALDGKNDTQTNNPSRYTRLPGAIRENGNEQCLIELGSRVTYTELNTWLLNKGITVEKPKPKVTKKYTGPKSIGALNSYTKSFIAGQYIEGTFNKNLYMGSCDAFSKGFEMDEVIELFEGITGYLDETDLNTIKSAYKRVKGIDFI